MRNVVIVIILLLAAGAVFYFTQNRSAPLTSQRSQSTQNIRNPEDIPAITVMAEKLDTPWAIAFLPDSSMLVTERPGTVRLVENNGSVSEIASIQNVREIGEGGLMGIALHPDFLSNNYVYLYYTYDGSGGDTLNRVVRMTFRQDQQNQLSDEQIIVDRITGAPNHNGGRIKFGPDKFLYIATGDAQEPSLAQNKNSLAGKILRVTDVGTPAPGNPFNTQVYSYGHRNPQGLAWDGSNRLWSTEHGPSGGFMGFGNDEVNLIEPGKNYGWPEIQGDQTQTGMEQPIAHSGTDTWAPAGVAVIVNSLFFGGLRGQSLYRLDVTSSTTDVTAIFKSEYGRIREVIAGPDGMLYITTSNHDGRGLPQDTDDRIIRINPQKL